jgi:hypothetical protein
MKDKVFHFVNNLDMTSFSEDEKIVLFCSAFTEQDMIDSMTNEYANLYMDGLLTCIEAIRLSA